MKRAVAIVTVLLAAVAAIPAPHAQAVITGPTGPSPYDVVRGWHKPFAEPGFAFGGNSGVFAESPEPHLRRAAWRGQAARPGSAGVRGLCRLDRDQRAHRHRRGASGATASTRSTATATSRSAGRSGISCARAPTDRAPIACASARTTPNAASGSINETFHQIYVFSNDGSKLLKTLGEKNVPGSDETHFAKPQDVAFLPDGRILVADGLDNHRVMILDKDMNYLGVRRLRQGARSVQRRPRDRDRTRRADLRARSLRRPHQRVQDDARSGEGRVRRVVARASGCRSTSSSTTTACGSPTSGRSASSNSTSRASSSTPGWCRPNCRTAISRCTRSPSTPSGNLYGGDNQYGRTQKFVPKPGADPALLIGPPWVAR